jgi:hypothetical protein
LICLLDPCGGAQRLAIGGAKRRDSPAAGPAGGMIDLATVLQAIADDAENGRNAEEETAEDAKFGSLTVDGVPVKMYFPGPCTATREVDPSLSRQSHSERPLPPRGAPKDCAAVHGFRV